MKQIIEIEVPDGKKAIWKDNKIVFEDIKLPKTWEEFCEQNEIKRGECLIDDYGYIKEILADKRYGTIDKNILPNKQAAEAHLALMQLHQLRDCYRQGWKPDYKDIYCSKYSIVLNKGIPYVDSFTCTNIFLSFQSREIAKEFLNNFRELIEEAGDLI